MRDKPGTDSKLIEFESGPVRASVRKSPRARRVRIRVLGDQVEVVVPQRVPFSLGWDALETHRTWVERQLSTVTLPEGHVWIDGRLHRAEYCRDDEESVELGDAIVRVHGPEFKPVLQSWLKVRAKRFAHSETPVIAKAMGVDYTKIQIRDQRTRWGSCSSRGTVTLNWRLAMAPVEVFRYVIVHELAHRREMNHSERFWAIVAQNCPEWQQRRDWLKIHGAILQIGRPAT